MSEMIVVFVGKIYVEYSTKFNFNKCNYYLGLQITSVFYGK